ncbi:ABC transporter permease [Clostridium sp. HBUAS56010]|uniref:ABC transporter permease n=1 Tax=Clostridium sp. HBUAS56010 TaxID=2571127 RepID=UPI00117781D4|nr:ABC transporter permease [Clostridium sp. HBUAS56010]
MERVPYVEGLIEKTADVQQQREHFGRRFCKNPMAVVGTVILLIFALIAIFAPQIAPYSFEGQDLKNLYAPPSNAHLFGTDNFGRDVFSRVIYGSRVSLVIGLISVGIGCSIGTFAGIMAAWWGGIVDHAVMCVIDIMQSVPGLLLAIALSAAMGPGLVNAMIAVGISSIPVYARIVRGSVLDVKGLDFVDAAIVSGAGSARVIMRHILPNILAPIVIQASAGMAGAILTAASLSFIGLGVQPPAAEWGSMISAGRAYIRNAWWIVTFPGIAIMATVCALNLLGDGLRDALDPQEK